MVWINDVDTWNAIPDCSCIYHAMTHLIPIKRQSQELMFGKLKCQHSANFTLPKQIIQFDFNVNRRVTSQRAMISRRFASTYISHRNAKCCSALR